MTKQRDADAIINEMADQIADEARRSFLNMADRAAVGAESPIERVFIAAVMAENESVDGLFHYTKVHIYGGGDPSKPPPFDGFHLFPQAQIGRHRVDFLLVIAWLGETHRIIIECDGHDFHEKTKDQAARDKKRDRDLALAGATVLRFTGSELWKAPRKCVEELSELICRRLKWGVHD